MASQAAAICDDVVTSLEGGTFTLALSASRIWTDEEDLKDCGTDLVARVSPGAQRREATAEGVQTRTYTVWIDLRALLNTSAEADSEADQIDAFTETAEQIIDLLTDSTADTAATCTEASTGETELLDVPIFRDMRILHCVIETQWQVIDG